MAGASAIRGELGWTPADVRDGLCFNGLLDGQLYKLDFQKGFKIFEGCRPVWIGKITWLAKQGRGGRGGAIALRAIWP